MFNVGYICAVFLTRSATTIEHMQPNCTVALGGGVEVEAQSLIVAFFIVWINAARFAFLYW